MTCLPQLIPLSCPSRAAGYGFGEPRPGTSRTRRRMNLSTSSSSTASTTSRTSTATQRVGRGKFALAVCWPDMIFRRSTPRWFASRHTSAQLSVVDSTSAATPFGIVEWTPTSVSVHFLKQIFIFSQIFLSPTSAIFKISGAYIIP